MLNLVSAGRYCCPSGREHAMRPFAMIDCRGCAVLELAIWAKQFHRKHLKTQIQIAGAEFHNRAFRTRRETLQLARQLAKTRVLQTLGLACEASDALTNIFVQPGRPSVTFDLLR